MLDVHNKITPGEVIRTQMDIVCVRDSRWLDILDRVLDPQLHSTPHPNDSSNNAWHRLAL